MEKPTDIDDMQDPSALDKSLASQYITGIADGLEVPHIVWWRSPGLRKLYGLMPILFLGATINGYDGSLLNGLQTMNPWQDCTCSNATLLFDSE